MKTQTRFINFLIDFAVFLLIVIITAFLLRDFVEREVLNKYLMGVYCLYYFFCELFIGQTVGKIITKTKVVTVATGEKPNIFQILIRTLSRLIPVDFISYFFGGNGIHDYLSKTKLVKK